MLTQSLKNLTLTNTVQSVIRARLDRLDHHSRESLRLASVIGREFAHRILEQLSSSKDSLTQSLEDLKVLELIQQIRVIPEAEYMFKHVITQEVTYETLLKQRRKELHGLVGQATGVVGREPAAVQPPVAPETPPSPRMSSTSMPSPPPVV